MKPQCSWLSSPADTTNALNQYEATSPLRWVSPIKGLKQPFTATERTTPSSTTTTMYGASVMTSTTPTPSTAAGLIQWLLKATTPSSAPYGTRLSSPLKSTWLDGIRQTSMEARACIGLDWQTIHKGGSKG